MRIQIIVIPILLLCACQPQALSTLEPTQIPSRDRAISVITTPDVQLDKITSSVIDDLSARLALPPKKVRVLSTESISWPDSSLGCPRLGETYTQETIPGYQIRLEADDQQYIYHTDTSHTIILCMDDKLPSFPVTPGEIDDGQPWIPVN